MELASLVETKPKPNIPSFGPGDTVKVSVKVREGEKERIQAFQGVVIKIRHGGLNTSFTVRRVTHGIGVERTFPLHSPMVDRVEVVRHGKVRRARLYYLRGLSGKAARIKERRVAKKAAQEITPEISQEETPELEQEILEETSMGATAEANPQTSPELNQEENPEPEQEAAEETNREKGQE